MDARILENEIRIRENMRQYSDRQAALSSNERIRSKAKSSHHWLKSLNNAFLLIAGRLD